MGRCSPCSTTVLRLYRHLLPSRSRNTVVDGEPVAARCSFLVLGLHRAEGNRGNRGKKDKEDRTPVTQTPLPLWSFVWSGLRVLSTGDVTSYSISYSRGNIPCLQPLTSFLVLLAPPGRSSSVRDPRARGTGEESFL